MQAYTSRHSALGVFIALALLPLMGFAPTVSAEETPNGKQMKLIIGFGAGGSYDLYGRTIARYMGGHLPNDPVIVPVTMPAAGSLAATNYIANVAPRDG